MKLIKRTEYQNILKKYPNVLVLHADSALSKSYGDLYLTQLSAVTHEINLMDICDHLLEYLQMKEAHEEYIIPISHNIQALSIETDNALLTIGLAYDVQRCMSMISFSSVEDYENPYTIYELRKINSIIAGALEA